MLLAASKARSLGVVKYTLWRPALLNPLQNRLVQPEAVRAAAQESQVAAPFRGVQFDERIGAQRGSGENVEGNEGVVPRLDEQRGHADGVEKADGGLRAVVVLRVAEAEGGGGDAVVDLPDGAEAGEIARLVAAGGAEARAHAVDEALLVEAIVGLGDAARASLEVEWRRDTAHSPDERRPGGAEFARQFP